MHALETSIFHPQISSFGGVGVGYGAESVLHLIGMLLHYGCREEVMDGESEHTAYGVSEYW